MADKVYAAAAGFVQFDPREREVNGAQIQEVVIKAFGSQKLVNVTIWNSFELAAKVKRGDLVFADGTFEAREYQAKDGSTQEGLQISPTSLVVIPGIPKAARETVQAAVAATPVAQGGSVPF